MDLLGGPRAAHDELPAGLVRPVPIDPTGRTGPTKRLASGPAWRRTSRGLYVPATVDPSVVAQRIVEAAAVLPEYGGVTGWASLRWHGGYWFDGLEPGGRRESPVWLATSCDDIRPQPGIVVSAERLRPDEVETLDGVRCTTVLRSLGFEMRYAETERLAVVVADMVAFSDLASLDEMWSYALSIPGMTGIPRMRAALVHAEENSWSPRETAMRLIWTLDAGLPRPLCNQPIFDRWGRHVGTPDLLDPEAGLVGEYDGAFHLEGAQRAHDLLRETTFRDLGLEYVAMVAADSDRRDRLVARIEAARRRARHEAESTRAWTIEQPAWWTPTETVEQRRALAGTPHERLLARRAG